LEKLDSDLKAPEGPYVLGGFDTYALRELAGHLRALKLEGTAWRLFKYERDHLKHLFDSVASDEAVGVGREGEEILRSIYGEFPLPHPDPARQAELQEERHQLNILSLRRLAERLRSLRADLIEPGAGGGPEHPTQGFFSVSDLADRHGVPNDNVSALRKRLERWRKKHTLGTDWTEADARARNDDRYLYRENAVLHLIRNE
jgi:hypothetical protein